MPDARDPDLLPSLPSGGSQRVPFGVWVMFGIFAIGLVVLIVMSNIDF